jgi:glycosyltransferase involved in cell wall biosynthesis
VEFIEATIRSVLLQGYPNLEYIIIDGGSDDGTVDVIRKYEPWLAYWVSEPDHSMYDAINKGFAHATGDVMAWLNSDDMYTPWGLRIVGEIFSQHVGQIHWISGLPGFWNADNNLVGTKGTVVYEQRLIAQGAYEDRRLGSVQQESTFWSRKLWERAGSAMDTKFRLAGDFDLWRRFAQYSPLYLVSTVISGFRIHPGQQTARLKTEYYAEVDRSLVGEPGRLMRILLGNDRLCQCLKLALWVSRRRKHMLIYAPELYRWLVSTSR